jgi:hypothetical protein
MPFFYPISYLSAPYRINKNQTPDIYMNNVHTIIAQVFDQRPLRFDFCALVNNMEVYVAL